jgi:Uma2 family endonuclease
MSKQPHLYHQDVCTKVCFEFELWNRRENRGKVILAPGLIFADDDDVVPDVVWLSHEALTISLGGDGKLHTAPEFAVEVLSPGRTNERRDREAKLNLYARRGVSEYWILRWQKRDRYIVRVWQSGAKRPGIRYSGIHVASGLFMYGCVAP